MSRSIHLPSTPIYIRAIASDIGEIGIYLREIAFDSPEIGIYIEEIAINWAEITSASREIAADIAEMTTNITEIGIYRPGVAAWSLEMTANSRVFDFNNQEISGLRVFVAEVSEGNSPNRATSWRERRQAAPRAITMGIRHFTAA